ncbi:MAG: DUF5684 domain-containing protein [Candidatus Nomurabacteria bacterium]|jgi:hypothetical protein|nr:DUF5684 domain-containing protein [Candidatus Nomurabacteria bacterium]
MISDKLLTALSLVAADSSGLPRTTSSSYSATCTVNGQLVPCDELNDTVLAILGGSLLAIILIVVGIYIITAVLMMKLFKKFDVAGWKAWVPFVNTWTFLELGGQHGWWQFVPVAGVIFTIIAAYNIGLKFNKGGAFVVLYIFLPIIWYIIMALKSTTLSQTAPTGEISVNGLGVAANQTVFANPVGATGPTVAGAAGTTGSTTGTAEPVQTANPAQPVATSQPAPEDSTPSAPQAPNDTTGANTETLTTPAPESETPPTTEPISEPTAEPMPKSEPATPTENTEPATEEISNNPSAQ